MLEAKLERTSWTYLQQILELSQMPEYQDIIIICKDDKISLNCFLLASIFPVIQKCLKGANISDEPIFISMPDYSTKDLSDFFNRLYRQPTNRNFLEFSQNLCELLVQTKGSESLLQESQIALVDIKQEPEQELQVTNINVKQEDMLEDSTTVDIKQEFFEDEEIDIKENENILFCDVQMGTTEEGDDEQDHIGSQTLIKRQIRLKTKRDYGDSASLGPPNPRHIVPDDLQKLIIDSNPHLNVKFTLSQRNNTQMFVDNYLLKKKKGPYQSRGRRVINWKCVQDTCEFTMVTKDGEIIIKDLSRAHNHSPDTGLFIRKQLRVKLRENMEYNKLYESPPGAVTDFVKDVVSNVDDIDSLGSIDALNQAARRYNRKLMPQQDPGPSLQCHFCEKFYTKDYYLDKHVEKCHPELIPVVKKEDEEDDDEWS